MKPGGGARGEHSKQLFAVSKKLAMTPLTMFALYCLTAFISSDIQEADGLSGTEQKTRKLMNQKTGRRVVHLNKQQSGLIIKETIMDNL